MAFQWLMDWLTGQLVLVDVPGVSTPPPVTGSDWGMLLLLRNNV